MRQHALREGGQAILEMVMVLPILLLLLFAVLGTAVYGLYTLSAINAAREGARAGAIYESQDAAVNVARQNAWFPPAEISADGPTSVVVGGVPSPMQVISVTVVYRMARIPLFVDEGEVRQTVVMRVEGR